MTSASKFTRYLIGGLVIAVFWYINKSRPPWEEALRTIVVFSIVMAFMKTRLKGRGVDVNLVPLIATKAVLVAIAAVVETGIDGSVSNPALLVALGLFVAVVLSGMIGDAFFFRSAVARPPAVGSY